MKSILLALLASAAVSLSGTSWAQFRTPEAAIKYRQSVMTVHGRAMFGTIGAMVAGRIPYDAKAASDSADLIALTTKLPWVAFGPDTNLGKPLTDAKPAVWAEPAKFKDLADKVQVEAVKLAAAARVGNLDALKAAFGPARDACKACHDAFTSQ